MDSGAVLVIDDNAENRALFHAALEDEGFTVETAESGEAGIARFGERAFDCVLLDIRMPGLDGFATCRRLRELPRGREVPILFVTAQRDVETFDRARDSGGDDYITKPVRPSELIGRVASAVRLHRLANERADLYEAVRRHRDDLVRLQLHKEQMIGFLVHDLKNPVNAIELQALRIERDRDASERARDAAAKIRDEARSLLRMVLNMLDLSRADEGKLALDRKRLAIANMLRELVTGMTMRARATMVDLELQCDDNLELDGDVDIVRRVIENLIDNAIRYAPPASTVRVSAHVLPDGVELRVADSGPGIPPDQREIVFDRFAQDRTSQRGSHGLGLAFCKVAAEAHGGRIWIEDGGPGAVLCVRFPR